MSTVTLYPSGPPTGVDLGEAGAVVTNYGAGSVSYSDVAEPFVAEGTIAATATATLSGTQFFRATTGAVLGIVELDAGLGSLEAIRAQLLAVGSDQADLDAAAVKITGAQSIAGVKTFGSSPIGPTPSPGDNTTKLATSAFVKAAIDALVAGAPGALDTLNELAVQLTTDESAVAALVTTVSGKAGTAASNVFTGALQTVKGFKALSQTAQSVIQRKNWVNPAGSPMFEIDQFGNAQFGRNETLDLTPGGNLTPGNAFLASTDRWIFRSFTNFDGGDPPDGCWAKAASPQAYAAKAFVIGTDTDLPVDWAGSAFEPAASAVDARRLAIFPTGLGKVFCTYDDVVVLGQTTLSGAQTVNRDSGVTLNVVDGSQILNEAGLVRVGPWILRYDSRSGNTLLNARLGAADTGTVQPSALIADGATVSQHKFTNLRLFRKAVDATGQKLTSTITLPTPTIPINDTGSLTASGSLIIGDQTVAYTSKDPTHAYGCTGGTGTFTVSSTVDVFVAQAVLAGTVAIRQSLEQPVYPVPTSEKGNRNSGVKARLSAVAPGQSVGRVGFKAWGGIDGEPSQSSGGGRLGPYGADIIAFPGVAPLSSSAPLRIALRTARYGEGSGGSSQDPEELMLLNEFGEVMVGAVSDVGTSALNQRPDGLFEVRNYQKASTDAGYDSTRLAKPVAGLRSAQSQTGPFLRCRDYLDVVKASINVDGGATFAGPVSTGALATGNVVTSGVTSVMPGSNAVATVVKQGTGAADRQQWQTAAGVTELSVNSTGGLVGVLSSASANLLTGKATGNANDRVQITAAGTVSIGGGTLAPDVRYFRNGAGLLQVGGTGGAADSVFVVGMLSGQSVAPFEVRTSGGSPVLSVGLTGGLTFAGTLKHEGANVGFRNVSAVAMPAALTQTYATATRTHANPTAAAVATTAAALASYGYTQAQADAIVASVNALVVDVANVKQFVNTIADDLQLVGLEA
jgi:hypothetical protein